MAGEQQTPMAEQYCNTQCKKAAHGVTQETPLCNIMHKMRRGTVGSPILFRYKMGLPKMRVVTWARTQRDPGKEVRSEAVVTI
mmetsp:Transcript_106340/g.183367  ORF Transcript_106340/g.183367 Transcript_106340/m.183367 type:complete len:83 (+) Transcript_106340:415-663(+)